MNVILTIMLLVGAVFFLADAICFGGFEFFTKGIIACCLTLKFFDEMP